MADDVSNKNSSASSNNKKEKALSKKEIQKRIKAFKAQGYTDKNIIKVKNKKGKVIDIQVKGMAVPKIPSYVSSRKKIVYVKPKKSRLTDTTNALYSIPYLKDDGIEKVSDGKGEYSSVNKSSGEITTKPSFAPSTKALYNYKLPDPTYVLHEYLDKNDKNSPFKPIEVTDSQRYYNEKNTNYSLLNPKGSLYKGLASNKNILSDTSKPGKVESYDANGKYNLDDMIDHIHTAIMLPNNIGNRKYIFNKNITHYNRFKISNHDLPLHRGFGHIFFVRPKCNLIESGHGNNIKLTTSASNHELFEYVLNHNPRLIGELCSDSVTNDSNDFMLSLSNFISSFSPSDEYIETDTYGRNYLGYSISYGKRNVTSKTAGSLELTFNDDRDLSIYQIIKMWVDYIDGVYSGKIMPKKLDIFNKIVDYLGALYYIITAEDGETIIFWSKYYGLYPTTSPSTQYAWGEGNVITNPQLSVTFNYSYKEDFNPYSILEFNKNAHIEELGTGISTLPIYDEYLTHASLKWGRTPYIQVVENSHEYSYKLRFTNTKKQ